MRSLIEQLTMAGPVVTDGAWGTELQARGLGLGEFPDLWNLERPLKVMEVASAYVQAGSRVILTNTFGANRLRLAEAGREKEVRSINRAGVEISKEAARDKAAVFASIGPCGKLLLNGDVTEDELRAAFMEQVEALAEGKADALVIETMSDLAEAAIAISAARSVGLPVVACMVFDSGKSKDRTMMGNTPEEVADALGAAGASAIGANCGQGIATSIDVCRRLKEASRLPVWIKPNAGLPQMVGGTARYATGADDFSSYVSKLAAAGASFVGGCCGTSPAFIRAVATVLEEQPRCA